MTRYRWYGLVLLGLTASQPALASDKGQPQEKGQTLDEVLVTADKDRTEISADTERLFNVAGAGLDPLAAVLSLPGVTFASDYSSEPAVRGSAPEDNAYYIDDIPARYVFHVFGNSIFNPNLIHSFELYPAAFGSQYSNATGAVIDVGLRDPKNIPLTTTLDWSFLITGAMVESRITENQAFYGSYRRSLIDRFLDEDDVGDEEDGIAVDQLPVADDYQFKYVGHANDSNRVSLVAAGASDVIGATFNSNSNPALKDPDFAGAARLESRFDSQGLIWDWASTEDEQRLKTLLSHMLEYDEVSYGNGQFQKLQADRLLLRSVWSQPLGENHDVDLGLSVENTDYRVKINAKIPTCSRFEPDCPTVDAPLLRFADSLTANTLVLYGEDHWQINPALLLTAGIHANHDDYLRQSQLEPRVRLQHQLSSTWTIHTGAGRYSQRPELVQILPQTGNPDLLYIQSDHYVAGVEHELEQALSWKAEVYYKDLHDVVLSLSEARDPDFAEAYSNDASGAAYGLEFLLDKKLTNRWYGWLAVSLSRTERQNERTGETLPFDFDKPVIVNLVANYKLDEFWLFGLRWSAQSGALYTPVKTLQASATYPDVLEPVYGELNSERLPFYHRLDLRAEYTKPASYGYWSVFADLLNVYDQRNIDSYRYAPNLRHLEHPQPDGFGASVPVAADEGIPFFPSIGFKIQF